MELEVTIKSVKTNIPIKELNLLKGFVKKNVLIIIKGLQTKLSFLKLDSNQVCLVDLLLINDMMMKKYNYTYRHQLVATNVLSLQNYSLKELSQPISLPIVPLGTIIISTDTLVKEILHTDISFNEHLMRLFIHGLLHLLGYSHEKEVEAVAMYKLEQDILSNLNILENSIIENYWK